VKRLPVVTAPRFGTNASALAVDRSVHGLLSQALSVHAVDHGRLATLKPDLLITQLQYERCAVSPSDLEAAVRAGLPSQPAIVSMRPNQLVDLWADVRAIADALGVPERGVQLVTRLRARMRGIAERTRDRVRPRVACLECIEPPIAAGDWTAELLAMAGAEDVLGHAGRHAGAIRFEQLAAADPDTIWVTPRGSDLARTRACLAPLTRHPGWLEMRAVRTGQVFLGDGSGLFHRPGPRVVETLECLAEALHPGAFRFGHEGVGWERFEPGFEADSPRREKLG
jgi:iron complex transport system substrate-binding protein